MNQDAKDPQKAIAGWMIVAIWLLIFGLLTLFFQDYLDKQRNPNQSVNSSLGEEGAREVVLERNRFGHYLVTGDINGHKVEFMLDTGATQIAIPSKMASKIGLSRLYEAEIHTANGTALAYGTKLKTVSVGDIKLTNLNAMITPGMSGDIALLGMGFLKHIEFTQRGNVLILRQFTADIR